MTDLVKRAHGCPSGKRKFSSRKVAKRWARSRNTFAGQLTRAYRCRECVGWHITTEPTGRVTFYRKERADGK